MNGLIHHLTRNSHGFARIMGMRCPWISAQAGFTLIELIVFIVIMGVAAVGIMSAISSASIRVTPTADQVSHATQIAQERMELILYQRRQLGFAGFTGATFDPCALASPPAQCSAPANYSFTPIPSFTVIDADTREVSVTVETPDGTPLTLTARVSNY